MFAYDADLQANIIKVLAAGTAPMAPAAVARALPVGGRPTTTALKDLLNRMVDDGRVVRIAGKTDTYRASHRDADPLAGVGAELERLIAGFATLGLPRDAVTTAMRRHLGAPVAESLPRLPSAQPDLPADAVIAAMHRLEPRVIEGAAVSIARLRDALGPRCDKASFDATLLALLERGVIELQSHAWPARLTADDKALLIDNGQGGWFDSAALLRRTA